MSLSVSVLLTILDSIAKGVDVFEAAVGTTGAEAGTVGLGAANNLASLIVVSDADVQADLVGVFRRRSTAVLAASLDTVLGGAVIQRAFDLHYGGLNAFLTAQDSRVHPNLRKLSMQIDAVNAFCPTAVDVAAFAVTGSGAGTLTLEGPNSDGSLDLTLYGKASFRVWTTHLIGAAPISATLTMVKADGSTQAKVVAIPAGTGSGVSVDVGTIGVDRYTGCRAITITGGTSGDAFKVSSVIERTITL